MITFLRICFETMKEKIIISGFCPEITKGGAFDLEEIIKISPRVLTSKEKPHYANSQRTEVGRVTGIKQGRLFKDRYYLKTSGKDVPLKFCRRDEHLNPPKVILNLADNYFFGRELVEKYE